jgi:hypothetical protein
MKKLKIETVPWLRYGPDLFPVLLPIYWVNHLAPPEGQSTGYLKGTIAIAGVLHHVEAIAVVGGTGARKGWQVAAPDADIYDDNIDALFKLAGESADRLKTVWIGRRHYVVYITPYAD